MSRLVNFVHSSIGQKIIMAVSGVLLVLFVMQHMVAHLLVFSGQEAYNSYAASVKSMTALVWTARIGLLATVLVHIWAAINVARRNLGGRKVRYAEKRSLATTYAARTMVLSGPLLAVFIVYHLLHFTFLVTGPGYSSTDVYGNMVAAFQVPWIVGVYVVSMVMLAGHLHHGIWSMLQTLGVDYPAIKPLRRRLAPILTTIIILGYLSVPFAIYFGFVQ